MLRRTFPTGVAHIEAAALSAQSSALARAEHNWHAAESESKEILKRCKAALSAKEREASLTRANLAHADDKIAELKTFIEAKEREVAGLREAVSNEEAHARNEHTKYTMEQELRGKIMQERDQLRAELVTAQTRAKKLEDGLAALTFSIKRADEISEENAALEAKLAAERAKREAAEKERDEWQTKTANTALQSQGYCDDLREKLAALQSLDQSAQAKKDLAAYKQIESDLAQTRAQLAEANEQLTKLRGSHGKAVRAESEANRLVREYAEMKEQLAAVTRELGEFKLQLAATYDALGEVAMECGCDPTSSPSEVLDGVKSFRAHLATLTANQPTA